MFHATLIKTHKIVSWRGKGNQDPEREERKEIKGKKVFTSTRKEKNSPYFTAETQKGTGERGKGKENGFSQEERGKSLIFRRSPTKKKEGREGGTTPMRH